jgi:hypothetical protein
LFLGHYLFSRFILFYLTYCDFGKMTIVPINVGQVGEFCQAFFKPKNNNRSRSEKPGLIGKKVENSWQFG